MTDTDDNLPTEPEPSTTPILTQISVEHLTNDIDHISGSDDEDYQPKSKTSTPDSKQSANVVVKLPLTKIKSSLVSDYYSEGEEENGNEIEEEEEITNVTIELMDTTPSKASDASPATQELSQGLIFPEDNDIKIPPEPTKTCSAKLEELYDPHWWGKDSYYDELGKAQKLEMEKREKERKDRTKIQYVAGIKKIDISDIRSATETGGDKRKTRFDQ
ncbi:unnamed protein product [Didymodactylos carnosus]|uniref:Uncharacterized protein n=2 Tax=Didymodactylos carnosus TaxID=1234261 RepID=A0A814CJC3_9BILA|nr:unnamed protein product [Didymodactylos carnosus]CAF3720389.1 unnamed protein product [Didymodactylos carnosus]